MSTQPITPEGNEEADFLSSVAHVPDEIHDDKEKQFEEMNGGQVLPPGAAPAPVRTCWTPEELAEIFGDCFGFLVGANYILPIGGPHWAIPPDKCLQLGTALCPYFTKYIPYESKPAWLPEWLLHFAAFRTVTTILGPPIRKEIEQLKNLSVKNVRVGVVRQAPAPEPADDGTPPQPPSMTEEPTMESMETATPSASAAASESVAAAKPSATGFQSNFRTLD